MFLWTYFLGVLSGKKRKMWKKESVSFVAKEEEEVMFLCVFLWKEIEENENRKQWKIFYKEVK